VKRRDFLQATSSARAAQEKRQSQFGRGGFAADVVIVGGSLGGCAAALAALRSGLRVVLTEETDWVGGQLTSQAVPPDEHRWIETHGATGSYRNFREAIREYYRRNYPLTETARNNRSLNPGEGNVSRLCHEPRVALAVFQNLFAPYMSQGKLQLLLEHRVIDAEVGAEEVRELKVRNLVSGQESVLKAPWYIDGTDTGDLLPLTKTEYVVGNEGRAATGELHAPEKRNPDNQQAFTMCLAADYIAGEEHVIEQPKDYRFWRDYVPRLRPEWPGRLLSLTYSAPATLKPRTLGFHPFSDTPGTLNLWRYRRLIHPKNFLDGTYRGEISLINWPQNDYLLGNLVEVGEGERQRHIERATQLSLSLFYWLQTEVPRPDGGKGWPGLRLRSDLLGTNTGVAKYPYVRESRRIKALFTVVEQHVGVEARRGLAEPFRNRAEQFFDSVGLGSYPIDLHPTSAGDNYIDFQTFPFQIPLGAFIPIRVRNLIPACKNIGTTHVTNGCYRLHPVEWNIGEVAGLLAAFTMRHRTIPAAVRNSPELLRDFQNWIRSQGVETDWPTT
jgi:hypothetical protein